MIGNMFTNLLGIRRMSVLCIVVASILLAQFITASPIPRAVHGRDASIYQRSSRLSLLRRELIIAMLDGGPIDSNFVDLLDQWTLAENALNKTPEGTDFYNELVEYMEATATHLTQLMEGVAILQSEVPSPTATEAGNPEATPEPTEVPEDIPEIPEDTDGTLEAEIPEDTEVPETREPETEALPTIASQAPTVTVIAQENTDIVVLASEGATTTKTIADSGATPNPVATGGSKPNEATPSHGTNAGQAEAAQVSNFLPNSAGRSFPGASMLFSVCALVMWSVVAF